MKTVMFLVTCIFWALSASANDGLHLTYPYKVTQATQDFPTPQAVLDQVSSVALLDMANRCSAVFISDTGYALTALHCLIGPSDYGPTNHPFFSMKAITPLMSDGLVMVADTTRLPLKMKLKVADMNYSWSELTPSIDIEVIATGKVFLLKPPALSATPEVLKVFHDSIDDYALVKLPSVPAPHKCVQVKLDQTATSTEVWHLGYPALRERWMRKSDFFEWTKNKSALSHYTTYPLYISSGSLFPNHAAMLEAYPKIGELGYADQIHDLQRFWVSSAPAMGGFSGGGAFDKAGNLIGINVAMLIAHPGVFDPIKNEQTGVEDYYGEFAQGVDMIKLEHIVKQLDKKFGREKVKTFFSCKN